MSPASAPTSTSTTSARSVARSRAAGTRPAAAGTGRRLLLVDGHSMAFRAFFALPAENFSTTTGQVTNAVYGFTAMLINLLRDEDPTHVAVSFDVSPSTFRTQEYPEYKAGRAATPADFAGQVDLIREVLAAMRVPVVVATGFEADDVIATLATAGVRAGAHVLVCTGDRDAFSLVGDSATVLYPRKGVSDLVRMTPEAIVERYGVPPERYPDLAALVGESSDNLPGVPGVGPKTAAKWLGAHGDLLGLVAAAPSLTGKAGASLRDHLDQVLRNRRVNELVRDVPLPELPHLADGADPLADLERRVPDREDVHQVFDGLEFRVLRDRLLATLSADEPVAEGGFQLVVARPTGDEVAPWLAQHAPAALPGPGGAAGPASGLTVLGRWAAGAGDAWGVAVAAPDGAAAHVDLRTATPEAEAALAAWLADAGVAKVLHDAKAAVHALGQRGLVLAGITDDTALAAYVCRPDQRSYDLADLTVRHLQRELRADGGALDDSGQLTLDVEQPLEPADGDATPVDDDPAAAADRQEAEAAAVRACAVRDLSVVLGVEVAERGGQRLLRELELPLVPVLAGMEDAGIAVDGESLRALEAEFAAVVEQAAQDAYAAIDGQKINLGSPKQLQVVLFEPAPVGLGMPKTKRTKTGWTTDAEALADLAVRHPHPFLEHLLRHRDASRLRQTVEGLLKTVADDGRIHTTFQQTIAATGRLSSTDPNLQNIPIRTAEGRRIREAFVVGAGYETLMTADYSQIEMRIMAHLSRDAGLIEAFRSGEDLHRFVGSRVYGVDPADVTATMRAKIKAMSYGLAYGLSAFGLSRQLGTSVEESRTLMEDYFDRFGGVRDYLRGVVDEARSTGWTETILGRRRYLPDLTSDNRQRREIAERMALNAPIQGSAADVIKVAMLGVDAQLRARRLGSRVLLQVHDELVVEVAPGESVEVEALLREQMAGAAALSVPLDVSVGTGSSWHEAGH